jgi:transcription elongation factor GreA
MSKFPITKKGHVKLVEEIKFLKHTERPAIIEAIASAREFGDLSENAEYHAARDKQSMIEGRIQDLEDKVARAEIIDINKLSGNTIKFGATVKLVDEDAEEEVIYKIVGEYEADLARKMISISSPIARALIGKSASDMVEVVTPKGLKAYEVLEVSYKDIDI